jgi:hypothetical protein
MLLPSAAADKSVVGVSLPCGRQGDGDDNGVGGSLFTARFWIGGMVVVVTGFLELFRDAGLGMVTIQREVTHEQTSILFLGIYA